MLPIFITFLYILFVLAAIVLVVVILLQEGKGGGLTDALGTSGQATFGVGSSGINRFTGATAAVFLVSALLIHVLNRIEGGRSVVSDSIMPAEFTQPPPGTDAPGGKTDGPTPAGEAQAPAKTPQ